MFRSSKTNATNILEFIASVPFIITKNIDILFDEEVKNYPNPITLPYSLHSSQLSSDRTIIVNALKINLINKISVYENNYRNFSSTILNDIISTKNNFLPDEDGKYSIFQTWQFLEYNLLRDLYLSYPWFIKRYKNRKRIKEELFKSHNIVSIAIFYEYYIQNKKGKNSEIGDLWHLSYIPYYDYAVFDNEKNNLIYRLKNENRMKNIEKVYDFIISIKCNTFNLKLFIKSLK